MHRNVNKNEALDGSFGSDRLSRLANNSNLDVEEGAADSGDHLSALLLPHPDDDTEDYETDYIEGFYSPRLLGGSEYVQQNLYMTLWLLTLLIGYTVERFSCHSFGIPKDCIRQMHFLELFTDVTSLFFFGLALGWLIGINESIRFRWLFNRKRWYFWLVYLGTPPVYSLISDIDAIKFSLARDEDPWTPLFISVAVVGVTAMSAAVIWHILAAWRRSGLADFLVYLGLRVAVFGWFAAAAVSVAKNPDVNVHLHHLYLGWALALWAEFNRPFSAVTLAIGCGIFVQGVAAYSFAPVFSSQGCFDTPASSAIKCSFYAKTPFTLHVCPGQGELPSYACTS